MRVKICGFLIVKKSEKFVTLCVCISLCSNILRIKIQRFKTAFPGAFKGDVNDCLKSSGLQCVENK